MENDDRSSVMRAQKQQKLRGTKAALIWKDAGAPVIHRMPAETTSSGLKAAWIPGGNAGTRAQRHYVIFL